jgi:hypothetical protein
VMSRFFTFYLASWLLSIYCQLILSPIWHSVKLSAKYMLDIS